MPWNRCSWCGGEADPGFTLCPGCLQAEDFWRTSAKEPLPEDRFTNTVEDAADYEAERARREEEAWRESERQQER